MSVHCAAGYPVCYGNDSLVGSIVCFWGRPRGWYTVSVDTLSFTATSHFWGTL